MRTSDALRLSLALLFIPMACGDDSAPTTVDGAALLPLVAHHPATHGVTGAGAPQLQQAYSDVDGGNVTARGGSVLLGLDAGGVIPRFPDAFIASVAVFGYAWADLDTGAAIVSVIHPVIGRDSHQNPDGWHTHPVQLSGGTGTSSFCIVSIGGSQAGIRITGDAMSVVAPARWLAVPAAALDVIASFIVQADGGCAGTGLGVAVLDAAGLR